MILQRGASLSRLIIGLFSPEKESIALGRAADAARRLGVICGPIEETNRRGVLVTTEDEVAAFLSYEQLFNYDKVQLLKVAFALKNIKDPRSSKLLNNYGIVLEKEIEKKREAIDFLIPGNPYDHQSVVRLFDVARCLNNLRTEIVSTARDFLDEEFPHPYLLANTIELLLTCLDKDKDFHAKTVLEQMGRIVKEFHYPPDAIRMRCHVAAAYHPRKHKCSLEEYFTIMPKSLFAHTNVYGIYLAPGGIKTAYAASNRRGYSFLENPSMIEMIPRQGLRSRELMLSHFADRSLSSKIQKFEQAEKETTKFIGRLITKEDKREEATFEHLAVTLIDEATQLDHPSKETLKRAIAQRFAFFHCTIYFRIHSIF